MKEGSGRLQSQRSLRVKGAQGYQNWSMRAILDGLGKVRLTPVEEFPLILTEQEGSSHVVSNPKRLR